jgi:flagellar hook-associated protein 1 FlgK
VVNLAIAANTSESIMDTKQSLLASVDTQRKSLSAVSLDEETTNLIIFQQSYNAAARIISVLDDMLNTMINNMGITGR